MMKNIIILSCFIFCFGNNSVAQVGISTVNPQKALHIAGSASSVDIPGSSVKIVEPTIRIDGLSNLNQPVKEKLRPVSTTENGDLVLSHSLVKPILMIDPINSLNTEKDYIPTPIIINQSNSVTVTNRVIRSFSFTITSPSLVKFSCVTSFQFQKASDGSAITDGSNRTWGTRFRFSEAPVGIPISVNAYFGESVHGYNNTINTASGTGVFYSLSDDTLFLPKGDYTLDVTLFAETNRQQIPLRIIYGLGSDTMSIVSYAIQ